MTTSMTKSTTYHKLKTKSTLKKCRFTSTKYRCKYKKPTKLSEKTCIKYPLLQLYPKRENLLNLFIFPHFQKKIKKLETKKARSFVMRNHCQAIFLPEKEKAHQKAYESYKAQIKDLVIQNALCQVIPDLVILYSKKKGKVYSKFKFYLKLVTKETQEVK